MDTDPAPRCSGGTTSIQDAAGVVRTGRQCVTADFNGGNNCGAAPGPCVTLTGTSVTGVFYPGSANTYCTVAPVITLSTNTLQIAVTARVTATVSGGVITALNVVSGGSGYKTPPAVTIAAPAMDTNLGKLCSLNPIPTLSASIAYPTAIKEGVTVGGACRPLGKNTYTNKVCSVPSAPGGEWNALNTFTCNVLSSFIPQPGSTKADTCGILAQSFTYIAPPNPTPAPTTTPAPTSTPTPTATPAPTPTPTSTPAPKTCTFNGVYRIEANSCRGQNIAYDIGSSACKNTNIYLRSSQKASGARIQWRLNFSTLGGRTPNPTAVVAQGRQTCKNTGVINLSPASNKPVLMLGGSGVKLVIQPVDENKSCLVVTIQASSTNVNRKYLGYKAPCSSETNFVWGSNPSGSTYQWVLKKI